MFVDAGKCEINDDGSVECSEPTIKFSSTPYICNLPYRSEATLEVRTHVLTGTKVFVQRSCHSHWHSPCQSKKLCHSWPVAPSFVAASKAVLCIARLCPLPLAGTSQTEVSSTVFVWSDVSPLQGQSFKYKVKFGSTRKGELGLPAGGV